MRPAEWSTTILVAMAKVQKNPEPPKNFGIIFYKKVEIGVFILDFILEAAHSIAKLIAGLSSGSKPFARITLAGSGVEPRPNGIAWGEKSSPHASTQ